MFLVLDEGLEYEDKSLDYLNLQDHFARLWCFEKGMDQLHIFD